MFVIMALEGADKGLFYCFLAQNSENSRQIDAICRPSITRWEKPDMKRKYQLLK